MKCKCDNFRALSLIDRRQYIDSFVKEACSLTVAFIVIAKGLIASTIFGVDPPLPQKPYLLARPTDLGGDLEDPFIITIKWVRYQ